MARFYATLLVALFVCACTTQAQTVTYPKTYNDFYTAVTLNSDASTCKKLIDALGLKATMSNPKLALTVLVPSDTAFNTMAKNLGISTTSMSTSSSTLAVMKSIVYYHFVTGSNGVKQVFPTTLLKAGTKLDTMYISSSTKKPYQLSVASASGTKVQIKSVGTSAWIYKPNYKCGAGIAHGIDNVLVPMALSAIPKMG